MMRSTATLLVALLLAAAPAGAQRSGPRVEIQLPPDAMLASSGPLVSATGMLTDSRVREALENGFPARLHFRVELWSTRGWFNSLVGRTEWDVVVRRRPLEERYEVVRLHGDGRREMLGVFATLAEAEASVANPRRAEIAPQRRDERFYYNLVAELEVLSVSDLDELERWLRGELGPAVSGDRNPGTALTRGLRTLMVRLLGGERRRYEARTVTFYVA